MTASPELIAELRASRPSAPVELRARVRALASEQPARGRAPWAGWRFPIRRGLFIAVPATAAVAIASAGVLGLARPSTPQALPQETLERSAPRPQYPPATAPSPANAPAAPKTVP